MLSYLWNNNPKILNYHLMPTKKELTKGRGEGRGERKKKRNKKKKENKESKTIQPDKSRDCGIFRQGCYSYFKGQSKRSTKSWNPKGVCIVGPWAGHPPLNVCKLRRFVELYQSSWVFNKLLQNLTNRLIWKIRVLFYRRLLSKSLGK